MGRWENNVRASEKLHYENNFVMCHTAAHTRQAHESAPIEHKTRLHTSQQREIIKRHRQGNINISHIYETRRNKTLSSSAVVWRWRNERKIL